MQIRLASDKDIHSWDDYVTRNEHASPYHQYAWRKSVESAYGMPGIYLMAFDGDNNVVGVLPSIMIKTPFSSQNLCTLPYCDRGEAIADSEDVKQALVRELVAEAKRNNVKSITYRGAENLHHDDEIEDAAYQDRKVRMILDLPESSDALLKGFKAKLRSQINKAKKNGLSFSIGNNAKKLDSFYQVFTQNMRDLGSPTHSKKWFQSIVEKFGDNCVISIVYYQDIPVGAGLILINGSTAAIPWASTLRSHNRLAPNMLLYWSLLEHATDLGCKRFDFGRSTYGEGTYRFKQQWGAKPYPLLWEEIDVATGCSTTLTSKPGVSKLRTYLETIWQRIPLAITVWLGSGIRKYISL